MSQKWMLRLRMLAYGAITLGWVGGWSGLGWSSILSGLLTNIFDRLVNFLLGGNATTLQDVTGLSSIFG